MLFDPHDLRQQRSIGAQFQRPVRRRTPVDREVIRIGQELRAGRGRGEQAHALAQAVVGLVHVAPNDRTHVAVLIDACGETRRRWSGRRDRASGSTSAPGGGAGTPGSDARRRWRAPHRVPPAPGRSGRRSPTPGMQLSSSTMRQRPMSTWPSEHERLAAEFAPHGPRLVVVARQAQHRHAQAAEQAAEMRIAGRVVLHQVAGDQHRRPAASRAPARARARSVSAGSVATPRRRLVLAAVQVRIGEMRQA